MSTEVNFNYDDVLLAKDSEGNKYYLCIYPDDQYGFEWSQEEWPLGRLITWHRYYTIGDTHDFEMPCDFWEDVFCSYFKCPYRIEGDLSEVKKLAQLMLDHANIRIRKTYSMIEGEPYYILCKKYDDINWLDNSEWGYLTTDKVEDMTEDDMGAFLEALRYLKNSEYEAMAKQLPDFVFFKVYMYDHSGIALSLTKDVYPFNDPFDAGCLGIWCCTKEEANKDGWGFNSDNWKQEVADVIEERIEEFNSIAEGNVWGFAYAPVEEFAGETNAKEIRSNLLLSNKEEAWGFVGEYTSELDDYCESEDLTITGVLES